MTVGELRKALEGVPDATELSKIFLTSIDLVLKEARSQRPKLSDLHLSNKMLKAFDRVGIRSLDDLLQYSQQELWCIPAVGRGGVDRVVEGLRAFGLSIRHL